MSWQDAVRSGEWICEVVPTHGKVNAALAFDTRDCAFLVDYEVKVFERFTNEWEFVEQVKSSFRHFLHTGNLFRLFPEQNKLVPLNMNFGSPNHRRCYQVVWKEGRNAAGSH